MSQAPASGDGSHKQPNYLAAHRFYLGQRTSSNGSIDWGAYKRAVAHRDAMQASGGSRGTKLTAKWRYFGPNNLASPYQIDFGPSPVTGRINAAAFDPSHPGRYYVASATGGVWKTENSGASWKPLSDQWPFMEVGAIAVHPRNGNIIYAGTGDYQGGGGSSFGVMKSSDGGNTWTNTGAAQFGNVDICAITVDPDAPDVVMVATGRGPGGSGYVWRSQDAGLTWQVSNALQAEWSDLKYGVPDPVTKRRSYYAVAHGNGPLVFKSDNRGLTWKELTVPVFFANYGAVQVAPSPTDPNTLYLTLGTYPPPGGHIILKSTDGGHTFSDISAGFDDGPGGLNWAADTYDAQMAATTRMDGLGNTFDMVLLGLVDADYTPDGGVTWDSLGGPTYTDSALTHDFQHAIAVNPANPNELLLGNDGGIYHVMYDPVANAGSIAPLNAFLGVTPFIRADYAPFDTTVALGGAISEASPASVGDPNNWMNPGLADGGWCAIDQFSPNVQYLTSDSFPDANGKPAIAVFRTDDYWTSSADMSFEVGSGTAPATFPPLTVDSTSGITYTAAGHLYQLLYEAPGWFDLGQIGSGAAASCLAVAPSDGLVIYASLGDNTLWVNTGEGFGNWVEIDTGLPVATVSSISVNPTKANEILVGLSGTGYDHLFLCSDTTLVPPTWQDVSGSGANGLPDVPLNAIARGLDDVQNELFIATDVGVFYTDDGGNTWTNATQPLGLPNVPVDDIKAVPGTHLLNAATYGRGIWRLTLPNRDTLSSLVVTPNVIPGTDSGVGDIMLAGAARPGGTTINLVSSNTLAATVPGSAKIAAGQKEITFRVSTSVLTAATKVTLTATNTANGSSLKTTITVQPPIQATVTVNPQTITAGLGATGKVALTASAPDGGASVALSSSSSYLSVPATVTVRAGQSTATFPITTTPVATTKSATVSATYNGYTSKAAVTIIPSAIATFTFDPTTVLGFYQTVATIKLTGPAPAGSQIEIIDLGPGPIEIVPAILAVPTGATSMQFTVTTGGTLATVPCTFEVIYQGSVATATITIIPI